MVLILSEKNDISTIEVINWLRFFKIPYLKITKEDKIKIKWIFDDVVFIKNNESYNLSEFKSYWYRRGYINQQKDDSVFKNHFEELIDLEEKKLREYLYYRLSKLKKINSIQRSDVNKLIISSIAREIGVLTPDDFIIDSKEELEKLLNEKEKISTKSISGHAINVFGNLCTFYYTSIIDKKDLKKYSNSFFPSLFQTYIEKKYELRVFYLNDKFYSMAIFSQEDPQTIVDFRNYNRIKPNRTVPYKLPESIALKLMKLMKKININCGSIDIIVTKENNYVFLEMNPVGQFGMVSKPCNYNIEKIIAEELMF